ncbi:MAG: AAA family ATPase [Oscillospiraceae bacterium]|jgi:chromosome partitioning protein|nr:AAA family ATPase [Oscillospiraceae bacterium]
MIKTSSKVKIIAVMNQKGGVGKTTTVVNLTACLAEAGMSVLALDVDPQANTTSALGVKPRLTIYDVLTRGEKIADSITSTVQKNLMLVPSDIRLAAAEVELLQMEKREHVLANALADLVGFDYVFIDCPPALGQLTVGALTAAHSVLIPIQCEYFALEGVGQLMKTIQMIKKTTNPKLTVEGVVLTMLDGRTNLGLQVAEQVKKHFKGGVYASVIPRAVRLSEAPSHGLPINLYDTKSVGAAAYRALAAEFINRN